MDVTRDHDLIERIDALLPQHQCRRCGYDGCRPYAEAIAGGDAINRCPPGGDPVIVALAHLTDQPIVPLDPFYGHYERLRIASIDEMVCIGCTLCIQACPVDAIVGAARQMHTVVSALCTGCELCVPPCPVDCIDMPAAGRAWSSEDAVAARARYSMRNGRLERRKGKRRPQAIEAPSATASALVADVLQRQRLLEVDAARARARARRAEHNRKMPPA